MRGYGGKWGVRLAVSPQTPEVNNSSQPGTSAPSAPFSARPPSTSQADGRGGSPAWSATELSASPHGNAGKQEKVRRMFAAIAESYDLNNRLHSFGRDQAWRKVAVRQANLVGGETVVDVACGTGDLTRAFAWAAPRPARVVGIDYTPEMLSVAERVRLKAARQGVPGRGAPIAYVEGDAQRLPLADASCDVVSVAFGIRNVQEPAAAVAEFFRVLRPGGRLVILEFDTPRLPVIRQINSWYTTWLMPKTATLISGDTSGAYSYLPKSVATFMDSGALSALLTRSGFADATRKMLTFGVCVCHRAVKPR